MQSIVFIVEKGEENYSCYSEQLPGVAATANTVDALKEEVKGAVALHLEGLVEMGENVPAEYTLEYVFDTQALLQYYSGIFSRAALSRLTGINERQLGHYIQGRHRPREDKAKKIEQALHKLGTELLSARLV